MRRFPIWLRVVLGIVAAAFATSAWQERGNVFVACLCVVSALLVVALVVFDILPLLQRIDEAGWLRAYYYYGAIRREERRVALARALTPLLLERTCSACGTHTQDGARFCFQCGIPLENERFKFCYHCEKSVVYEAQFCPFCRFPVGEHVTGGIRLIGHDEQPTELQLVNSDDGESSGEHAVPPDWLVGFQPHMVSSVWEELGVRLREETAKQKAIHAAIGKDVQDDEGGVAGSDLELPIPAGESARST